MTQPSGPATNGAGKAKPANDAEAEAARRHALEGETMDLSAGQVRGSKSPPKVVRKLSFSDAATLARALAPTPWVVRALQIAPGRPLLWTAAAGSAKTWLAMSLGLSVAGGLSSWLSTFPIQKSGPVLHINLEMHRDEIARRYQRLARGMGVDLATLPIRVTNRLDVPTGFSLMAEDVVEVLSAAVAGHVLCVIDSFRAFIGGVDENKSEVRQALDVLLSVTERTSCAFLVIHHEGKPPKDGEASGTSSQHRARGSSAIVDAVDLTYSVTVEAGCFRITQGKASMGQKVEPFTVKLVDSGDKDEDGRSAAIAVEYVHPEEAAELATREPPAVVRARDEILQALRIHGSLNVRQIERGKAPDGKPFVRGNKEAKHEALEGLLADSLIVEHTKGRQRRFSLP